MRFLHTMIRVRDLEQSLEFYCNKMGLVETRRVENEGDRYTLIFLAASEDETQAATTQSPLLELTYNWDGEPAFDETRKFGHLAYEVDDIYGFCQSLVDNGVTITAHRAMVGWRLFARRMASRLNSCRKGMRWSQPSHG